MRKRVRAVAVAEAAGTFGDPGSSAFPSYALGTLSGGAIGDAYYARTDTAAAREFLSQFVTLP